MASEHVQNVGDADFKKQVLESSEPVLVDFWATWCAPCRAIAPAIDELASQYQGRIKVAKVNIDDNQDVPQQYGIRSIPTLLLFKGGRVVDQVVGSAGVKAKLEEAFRKVL
jgi:thioredoxin 1